MNTNWHPLADRPFGAPILFDDGKDVAGHIILRQGMGQIRTSRTGFGLATVTVSSLYNFGGVVDLPFLIPTAGREALSTESMAFLQGVVTSLQNWASQEFGNQPATNENLQFIDWARRHGRFDLCDALKIRIEPGETHITLAEVKERGTSQPLPFYAGGDQKVIDQHASVDSPLLVGSIRSPRKECEQAVLDASGCIVRVSGDPSVLITYNLSSQSGPRIAIVHRLEDIVERDYFLPSNVNLGSISFGLPILIDGTKDPVSIVLDPDSHTFQILEQLYRSEYSHFLVFIKDFVRGVVFPKISDYVPSSTRQGAEAFLRTIGDRRESFEYALADRSELASIWDGYHKGELTFEEAANRSRNATAGNVQIVAHSAAVTDLSPDLVSDEEQFPTIDLDIGEAAPPITRPEIETNASLLTISPQHPALHGYRCFLAVTNRALVEKGEFFRQPHRTSIVWGGQKVLFVFQHHSNAFGLYYDIQCDELVSPESGGGANRSCTLILGDKIYIPLPDAIAPAFVPSADATKRLEIRVDVLHVPPDSLTTDSE